MSRDPLGLWGDPAQRGNGQTYCGNNPVNLVDPRGDQSWSQGHPKELGGGGDTVTGRTPEAYRSWIEEYNRRTGRVGEAEEFVKICLQEGLLALGEELPPIDLVISIVAVLTGESPLWFEFCSIFVPGMDFVKRLFRLGDRLKAWAKKWRNHAPDDRPNPSGPRNGSDQEVDIGPNGGCFLAGTLVLTPAGGVPIEKIKPGDLVLSRDEKTGAFGYKRVVRTFPGVGERVCRITTSKPGRSNCGPIQKVLSTPTHDYFRADDGSWVDAELLRPGDRLVTSAGEVVEVLNVEVWTERVPTWDLQVEGFQTYFVQGAGKLGVGLWVHNNSSRSGADRLKREPYRLGPNDEDWRGTGRGWREAVEDAFQKTGLPADEFEVTKWGKDANGKSMPVEWRHPSGAEVNIDWPHDQHGPDAPHIGWQTGGKRSSGGGKRGHTLVDEVPANR